MSYPVFMRSCLFCSKCSVHCDAMARREGNSFHLKKVGPKLHSQERMIASSIIICTSFEYQILLAQTSVFWIFITLVFSYLEVWEYHLIIFIYDKGLELRSSPIFSWTSPV